MLGGGGRGLLSEGGGLLRVRASDRLQLVAAARRRPLREPAEPLATDAAAYHAAGSGGATAELAAVARHGLDELRLGGNGVPFEGAYVYADGRALRVSDGNTGYMVAAGGGLDLARLLRLPGPLALVARADSFAIGYREQRAEYFSPAGFDGHLVGGQLAWRTRAVAVSAHGGGTFTLGEDRGWGWSAGGGLELALDRITLTARFEHRDDVAYAVWRGWLAGVVAL